MRATDARLWLRLRIQVELGHHLLRERAAASAGVNGRARVMRVGGGARAWRARREGPAVGVANMPAHIGMTASHWRLGAAHHLAIISPSSRRAGCAARVAAHGLARGTCACVPFGKERGLCTELHAAFERAFGRAILCDADVVGRHATHLASVVV